MEFMKDYNPDLQVNLIKERLTHSDIALKENIPSLGLIRSAYGENIAIEWLIIQFGSLNDYAEQGVGLRGDQMKELSEMYLAEYYYINAAEVCLFIARLKLGKYGQFYGAIGAMKIMSSMCEYINERRNDIDRYTREKNRIDDEIRREEYKEKAVSYDEFIRIMNKDGRGILNIP